MIDIQYANSYREVLEILKYISKDEYNKIPKEKIEFYQKNANKEYNFTYNPILTLDEQNVSKITKGIIAILFRDYWATPEQREKILNKQKYERIKLEEEKRRKYNPNDLFKNKRKEKFEETTLVEIKKQKWYEKIFSFIRKILKKDSN